MVVSANGSESRACVYFRFHLVEEAPPDQAKRIKSKEEQKDANTYECFVHQKFKKCKSEKIAEYNKTRFPVPQRRVKEEKREWRRKDR